MQCSDCKIARDEKTRFECEYSIVEVLGMRPSEKCPFEVIAMWERKSRNWAGFSNAVAKIEGFKKMTNELERKDVIIEKLKSALNYYAKKSHITLEMLEWESVSGESQNWKCVDTDQPFMYEDGSIAKQALLSIDNIEINQNIEDENESEI